MYTKRYINVYIVYINTYMIIVAPPRPAPSFVGGTYQAGQGLGYVYIYIYIYICAAARRRPGAAPAPNQ